MAVMVGNNRIPDFFIVGAPKCGTSSVATWLREHPAVFLPSLKEPSFFDTDSPRVGVRTLRHYLRCFSGASAQHAAVGEASPNYLFSTVAIAKILKFNPDARLIVLIRNPVEMAASLHAQLVYNFHEDVTDFAVAWSLQQRRKAGLDIPKRCRLPQFLQYRAACSLGEQLQRLQRVADPNRVHIVLFDDLKKEPRAVYRSILEFLGLSDDGRTEFPVVNARKAPPTSRWHLLLRNFGYLKQHAGVAHLQWGLSRLRGAGRADAMPSVDGPLTDPLRAELECAFREDIEVLERLLRRPLSAAWLRSVPAALSPIARS